MLLKVAHHISLKVGNSTAADYYTEDLCEQYRVVKNSDSSKSSKSKNTITPAWPISQVFSAVLFSF